MAELKARMISMVKNAIWKLVLRIIQVFGCETNLASFNTLIPKIKYKPNFIEQVIVTAFLMQL